MSRGQEPRRAPYSDTEAAALYDILNPWGPSDDFYLSYVMAASSVLDVGCGTGLLLRTGREAGHSGRLVGLDPDRAALARARKRSDIDWVEGRARDIRWSDEFELAVMAGNAFQVLVTDEELRASVHAIRGALLDGGQFVFGTRNPAAREWEDWNPSNAFDVIDHDGRELRIGYNVTSVDGDVVTLTETTAARDGEPLRVDEASLRFLGPNDLDGFLVDAGFVIESRYGDWSREPFTPTSQNIITVARAA